jgi:hypothetical protein
MERQIFLLIVIVVVVFLFLDQIQPGGKKHLGNTVAAIVGGVKNALS